MIGSMGINRLAINKLGTNDRLSLGFSSSDVPTNLALEIINDNTLRLTWIDNSIIEDSYIIYRSVSGGAFSELSTVGANVETFDDTTCEPDILYAYKIRGYKDPDYTDYSDTVSETIDEPQYRIFESNTSILWRKGIRLGFIVKDYALTATAFEGTEDVDWANKDKINIAITPPNGVPYNAIVSVKSTTELYLDWLAGSTDHTGHYIEISLDSSSWSALTTIVGSGLSYTVTGLTANTTYYFRICAYRGGYSSAYSDIVSIKTPASTWVSLGLTNFRAAVDNIKAGNNQVYSINVIGDSIGEGSYSEGCGVNAKFYNESWAGLLRRYFSAKFGEEMGVGLIPSFFFYNTPVWTFDANWVAGNGFASHGKYSNAINAVATIVFPGTSLSLVLDGHKNISVVIDGGTPIVKTGNLGAITLVPIATGLSNTEHTAVITVATTVTSILGAMVDSGTKGFLVNNTSYSGGTAYDQQRNGALDGDTFLNSVLTIIALGGNDLIQGYSTALYKGYMQAIIDNAKAMGDVIICTDTYMTNKTEAQREAFQLANQELAATNSCQYVDLLADWYSQLSDPEELGYMCTEHVHWNAQGHINQANKLINLLDGDGLSALLPTYQIDRIEVDDGEPTEILIKFNSTLNPLFVPDKSAFTVGARTINSISLADNIVTLVLAVAILDTDTITVSYTKPVSNYLRVASSNANIDSFTDHAVCNLTLPFYKIIDLFNDSQWTRPENRLPQVGGAWTLNYGIYYIGAVKAGAVHASIAAVPWVLLTQPLLSPNVVIDFDIIDVNNSFVQCYTGMAFRYTDESNGWKVILVHLGNTWDFHLRLYKNNVQLGSNYFISTQANWTFNVAYHVKIVCLGDSIKVYWNNSATALIDIVDSANNNAIRVGPACIGQSNQYSYGIDNLYVS